MVELSIGLTIFFLLLFSAIASGTEAAIFAIPYSKVLSFVEEKKRGALALQKIKDNLNRPIMAIVIVNNIANIVGTAIVSKLAYDAYKTVTVSILMGTLTFLVIAFAEIVPKTVGERRHERISLLMAPLIVLLSRVITPLIWLIEQITLPFSKLAGESTAVTSEAEIRALTLLGSKAGVIEDDEKEMIERVFRLNDTTAWDIMTPLAKVDALDGRQTLGSIRTKVEQLTHTRLPVHTGSLNQITGVVHLRDILQALAEDKDDQTVQSLATPPSFIPSNVSVDALLKHFKRTKYHLAVVVDALGTVLGILTLEDALEELVGEIIDETDIEQEEVEQLSNSEAIVLAETDALDVNQLLAVDLPDMRIGALIIEELGRIPNPKETFKRYGVEFTIIEATPRMIQRVLVRRLSTEELVDEDTEVAIM